MAHAAIKLTAYRLLLAVETRRVQLQQIALCAHQAGGVVLPHLLLKRAICGLTATG
jgi:hypothetical protein